MTPSPPPSTNNAELVAVRLPIRTGWRKQVRFAEGEVGADGDAGAFVSFGDDLEQQFGSAGVDLDVAQLVEQQQVQAGVSTNDAG